MRLPSSAFRRSRGRLRKAFDGADWRVCVAFWTFGLINNVFYVIILSSALDLVGTSIPKATVLLACIIPGLATKAVVPYFIHLIPYSLRILLFAALSTCGMLAVALSPLNTSASSISSKIAGIILANISSGAGEVCFLGLTAFYGPFSLAAWGSGTGAAGLVGSACYTLATTALGFSVPATLLASALMPIIMLLSYFTLLPLGPLKTARRKELERLYEDNSDEDEDADDATRNSESASLLDQGASRPSSPAYSTGKRHRLRRALLSIRAKLARTRMLVVPYMIPLFLVYLAEYTINQGVAPTLLFPLAQSPFKRFRDFYPTYSTVYQLGVFISRSSLPFLRVRALYLPSILQVLNLAGLVAHALFPFIPTVWFVFAIVFWEGLLGGLVYVATFAAIREEVPMEDREFSLGVATISDSAGIFAAGLLGSLLEPLLCAWQVDHGRDWCRRL